MKFVEVYGHDLIGYQTLFSFQSWRIAVLNYIDELEIKNIHFVEMHSKTDEAFVLLEGHATLIFAEVEEGRIKHFDSMRLEKNKVYRIPQEIYHTHTLSKDCKLLIIEEDNTSMENSKRIYFNEDEMRLFNQTFKEVEHV